MCFFYWGVWNRSRFWIQFYIGKIPARLSATDGGMNILWGTKFWELRFYIFWSNHFVYRVMEEFRFEVVFLKEAKVFIESQRENVRSKIIYNNWKWRKINDPSLFNKLQNDIWEFRTRCGEIIIGSLPSGIKEIAWIPLWSQHMASWKKPEKFQKKEFEKVERIREQYYKDKIWTYNLPCFCHFFSGQFFFHTVRL